MDDDEGLMNTFVCIFVRKITFNGLEVVDKGCEKDLKCIKKFDLN